MSAVDRHLARAGAVTLIAAVLVAPYAAGQETAREWFESMGKAIETLNYRGTLVHTHDNQLEMMEVLHKVEDGRVFERVTAMNGAGREVVREGDKVRCIDEQRKQILVNWGSDGSPLRDVLPTYDASLEKHYVFELRRDADKISGRPVHLVAVRPRDEFRYGYRLWLDRATAMPLLCELVGAEGKVIEAVQFTEIAIGGQMPDELFKPRLKTTNYSEVAPARRAKLVIANDQARWRVESPPPGFSLSVVTRHDNGEKKAEHMVYTDGVASISIFAETQSKDEAPIDGIVHIGAANAFGRHVGGYQITVMGEVPPVTVERIGKSIRPVQ